MARKPAGRLTVRLTTNFERNLADIERFLTEAKVPQAYDALLDELLDTAIPNLERFPRYRTTVSGECSSLGRNHECSSRTAREVICADARP